MILSLSNWAQGIIVAVIIATIIEMILPKSNLKKYIKVVIGIYILFTIVSPIINKISGEEISINNVLDVSRYEEILEESNNKIAKKLDSNNSRTIKDIYVENLKNDITSRLKQKNYEVSSVYIKAKDDDTYTITEMRIYLDTEMKKSNSEVNEITIHVNEVNIRSNAEVLKKNEVEGKLNNLEKEEIRQYIADTYSISKDIIYIM